MKVTPIKPLTSIESCRHMIDKAMGYIEGEKYKYQNNRDASHAISLYMLSETLRHIDNVIDEGGYNIDEVIPFFNCLCEAVSLGLLPPSLIPVLEVYLNSLDSDTEIWQKLEVKRQKSKLH